MELRLNSREQRLLSQVQTDLVSAVDFPSADAWRRAVLTGLRDLVGADRGIFFMTAPGVRLGFSEDFSEEELQEQETILPVDTGRARVRSLGLEVWTHHRLLRPDPDVFYKSWLYHDFYRPRRLEDGIGYQVESADHTSYAVVKLHSERPGTRGFGEHGRAALALLLPAFKAGVRTWMLAAGGRPFTGVIDSLPDGAALFNEAGTLLHRNSSLQRMLAADPEHDSLDMEIHEVQAAAWPSKNTSTSDLLAGPALRSGSPYQRAVSTTYARYELWASMIREPTLGSGSMVVVFVRARVSFDAVLSAAAGRYALTPRETEVLRQLVRGASAKEIASALGMRVSTARRHTEALMRKCGVHSRSALAHLLLPACGSAD